MKNEPVEQLPAVDGVAAVPVPDPIGDELRAMHTIAYCLQPLDALARHRVLVWVADVLGIDVFDGPPEPDHDGMLAAAADWAGTVIEQLVPEEIEQVVLNRQGWGDEVGLIEGALPEIAKRVRIVGGAAKAEPDGG